MRCRTIVLVVAMLLSTPVFAQSQTRSEEDRTSAAAIEERYKRVYRQYRQQTLGRKRGSMDYQQPAPQKKRVQELIERAEAGETVTTEEVDRALGLTR